MTSGHLKRLAAPKHWPIHRKEFKWTVAPSPGPHPKKLCIPLLIIVRDILGLVETGREARKVIKMGEILVDGRPRKDHKFPVGIMDVIEIPKIEKAYRILPWKNERFILHEISKREAKFKLCRIQNKTTVKGGRTQLNLHDGRNILLENGQEKFKVGSVLQVRIPNQKILNYIPMEEGVIALILLGKNSGKTGIIRKVYKVGLRTKMVTLKSNGNTFESPFRYVFPIGREKPLISLPKDGE